MAETIIWFLASAGFVDMVGYWLHRWSHRPKSPLYRSHMTHHVINYPSASFLSEKYKGAGSDNLAFWFAPFIMIYVAAIIIIGLPHQAAIFSGGGVIAVGSVIVHDLTHITNSIMWRWPLLNKSATWHRIHHRKMGKNFGIIFSCWDRIFRTRYLGSSSQSKHQDHRQ
jgi:sterol desaturase/sphingolipid hydroxylase (fatty acid hydroxylase superfamily)